MGKSFYRYMERYRNSDQKGRDKRSEFAELVYTDQSFPRTSKSFEEISSYIELSDRYYSYVQTFDEAWRSYQNQE